MSNMAVRAVMFRGTVIFEQIFAYDKTKQEANAAATHKECIIVVVAQRCWKACRL